MASSKASFEAVVTHKTLHTSSARLHLAHDTTHLATSADGALNIVHLPTATVALRIHVHPDEFTAYALHPTKHELVAASRSRMLRHYAYDLASANAKLARSWKAHKLPVTDLAYEPRGTLVASASADSTVMVFDVSKGYCTHVFRGHSGVVHRVVFAPKAMLLASAAADRAIRLWDLKANHCSAVLDAHVGLPRALVFADDGATLYSGGADQLLNIWEVPAAHGNKKPLAPKPITSLTLLEPIESIALVGMRGELAAGFITAGGTGLLRAWDAETRACVRQQPAPGGAGAQPSPLTQLLRLGDDRLLGVTEDYNLLVHDAESLAPLRCIVGDNAEITDLKLVPVTTSGEAVDATGAMQLAVASNSEQIKLFDLATMDCRLLYGHTDVVLALDVSSDGRWIASSSKDCAVRIWDAVGGTLAASCVGHVESVGAVAFGGGRGVLLSAAKDRTLKRWDLESVIGVAAPPPKRKGGSKSRCVTEPVAALCTVVAHSKEVNALAVAPNDRVAVTGSQDRTLKVWALGGTPAGSELKELATLSGHKRAVWTVALSPIDKLAASGSGDMMIRLWSLSTYQCIRAFAGHLSSVLKVRFASRGHLVVSSGSDGLVKVWAAKSPECLATLDAHEDKVWALDARDDANGEPSLVSGAADSTITLWRDTSILVGEAEAAEQSRALETEQRLANAIAAGNYAVAVAASLELRRPRALREALVAVPATVDGDSLLARIFAQLGVDDAAYALNCARDWNTRVAHALTAQRLLYAMLRGRPAAQLAALPETRGLIESLLPYTERHYDRIDRLLVGARLVPYILGAMRRLEYSRTDANEITSQPAKLIDGLQARLTMRRAHGGGDDDVDEDAFVADEPHDANGRSRSEDSDGSVPASNEGEVSDAEREEAPRRSTRARTQPARASSTPREAPTRKRASEGRADRERRRSERSTRARR